MSARGQQAIAHLADALAFRALTNSAALRNMAVREYWQKWADEQAAELKNYMRRSANRNRSALLADLASLTGRDVDSIEHHALIEYALAHMLMLHSEAEREMKLWRNKISGRR